MRWRSSLLDASSIRRVGVLIYLMVAVAAARAVGFHRWLSLEANYLDGFAVAMEALDTCFLVCLLVASALPMMRIQEQSPTLSPSDSSFVFCTYACSLTNIKFCFYVSVCSVSIPM
ncbi:hypothetical protein ACQJBY_061090 [Aegilops geniculata]